MARLLKVSSLPFLLSVASITAVSVKLESLDGSRCYGFTCSDPMAGNPQAFPSNLPLNKELPFQVSLSSPAASATSVQLRTSGHNSGGCQFSTTRLYPAGHIHTDEIDPDSRPWDARLAVADDSYELAHAYRNLDASPSSAYSDTLTVTIAQGTTSAQGFVRCTTLNETGAAIQVTGTGIVTYMTPPIAVLSPCRYPALVGELQSGHCTEFCKVRHGSLAFRVELGHRVELQDVSVENRGSCCGRGDPLPQVLVTVGNEWTMPPTHTTAPNTTQNSTVGTLECGPRVDVLGPSATPIDQAKRFGAQGQEVEADPSDGPIRKLHISGVNKNPPDGPNDQQTRVFYCNRHVGRYVVITTTAPATGQYMICEVQVKVNFVTPEIGYTDGNSGTTTGRLQTVDVKIFPEMWSSHVIKGDHHIHNAGTRQ